MKVLCVFGTRPEIIKLSPIVWAARRFEDFELTLAHTGQHYDYLMSDVFIQSLGIPKPKYNFEVRGGPVEQIAKIMVDVEGVLKAENPDVVLVQGDTNTVPAVCIVARRMLVPVGHVEAGLRSFNERSPEEANRRIATALALQHFAPTWLNYFFLTFEGVPASRIHVTGNTIMDVLLRFKPQIEASEILDRLGLEGGDFILLTVHRPENVDNPENLGKIVEALSLLEGLR
ncbi:MAG: UDP-N-acetylglucosamine 2-epimerase (non-hydrolyzing), partial [Candidatus Hecatellales archaeon]